MTADDHAHPTPTRPFTATKRYNSGRLPFIMNYEDWSTAEVVRQLKQLGFGQYSREFQTNEIKGVHLPLITEDHLKEMGVTSIGHRILMLRRFADIAQGKAPKNTQSLAQQPKEIRRSTPAFDEPKRPAPTRSISEKTTPAQAAAPAPSSQFSRNSVRRNNIANPRPSVEESSDSDSPPPSRQPPRRQPVEKKPEPTRTASSRQEDAFVTQKEDFMVTCQYCGRKLQPDAAKRHIPVCGRINQGKTGKR